MRKNRNCIIGLFLLLMLLLAVAACIYKKDQEQQSDHRKSVDYADVLSEETLEKYDMGITYHQLVEEPEVHQLKTTVVLSGEVNQIYEVVDGIRRIDIITEEGVIWGYIEDKEETLKAQLGDTYVVCGQFQGLDDSGNIPLIRILIMERM